MEEPFGPIGLHTVLRDRPFPNISTYATIANSAMVMFALHGSLDRISTYLQTNGFTHSTLLKLAAFHGPFPQLSLLLRSLLHQSKLNGTVEHAGGDGYKTRREAFITLRETLRRHFMVPEAKL